MEKELNYALWFHELEGIGLKKAAALMDRFHNAKGVFCASEKELRKIAELNNKDIDTILYRRNAQQLVQREKMLEQQGIQFVSLEDEHYPYMLRHLVDAPFGLYYKGSLPKEDEKVFAIVGARMCTPYGKSVAKELAKRLATGQVSVISGMARGIDGYAHQGCIDAGGKTYAVLAGGVDMVYPPEHRNLYDAIIKNGGIISEYPPGTEPVKGMFPRRNRIISGLSQGVIVVEAKKRSGSLITADCALEQGKDVYAVPGRIQDPLSEGCNNLIRQGAGIMDDISEFMREMCFEVEGAKGANEATEGKNFTLEKEESMVYSCLRLTPQSLDEVMNQTELDLMTVISCIARLEELGLAEECYKNYYIRST